MCPGRKYPVLSPPPPSLPPSLPPSYLEISSLPLKRLSAMMVLRCHRAKNNGVSQPQAETSEITTKIMFPLFKLFTLTICHSNGKLTPCKTLLLLGRITQCLPVPSAVLTQSFHEECPSFSTGSEVGRIKQDCFFFFLLSFC